MYKDFGVSVGTKKYELSRNCSRFVLNGSRIVFKYNTRYPFQIDAEMIEYWERILYVKSK